jgi:hypothetical protein
LDVSGVRLRIIGDVKTSEVGNVLSHPTSQELLARDITRLAYVALDGTPRAIPIGFTWNGAEIVMTTPTHAPTST